MSTTKEKKSTLSSELKRQGMINNDFLDKVSELTIEQLVTLKLETSARMYNGKLYGLPLWHSLPYIIRDSLMDFVFRNCKTKADMSNTLGIPYEQFSQMYRNYIKE